MRKPSTLAEMIAKKSFDSAPFQQAWSVHMQAFGPILAPAYPDCYTARVHLTGILNKLSRRDVAGAKATMQQLQHSCGCPTDAEKALWFFLEGLCGELSGDAGAMTRGYRQCCEFQHDFYLPHLKLAKATYAAGDFDDAYRLYMTAAAVLDRLPPDNQRNLLLSSALTNAASCLASARRFDDALALLKKVRTVAPNSAIDAVEAAILSAMQKGADQ